MKRITLIAVAACALTACRAPAPREAEPMKTTAASAWSPDFDPPRELTTPRLRLEPLAPRHARLDYEAAMGSREHLHRTLNWGSWPRADMTVEDNRKDLERHAAEFEKREGYAYTVLAPDGRRCLGCVYLNPPEELKQAGGDPAHPAARGATLAWWVIEAELPAGLDAHLVQTVLEWIERDFPIDLVALPVEGQNARGVEILTALGLEHRGPSAGGKHTFIWRRAQKQGS